MTEPVSEIARSAAARLSDSHGASLVADVEAELEGSPRAFIDPISIASLIVGIASLAWNIYTVLRRSQASRAELAAAVRERWAQDHEVDATASAVIDVVAEETVKRGER